MELSVMLTKDDIKTAIKHKLSLDGYEMLNEPVFNTNGSCTVIIKKKPEPKTDYGYGNFR